MGRADTVSLTYTAEVKDLREKLASIPGITAAESRKAVAELNKSIRAAERAANAAAKSASGWRTLGESITLALTPGDVVAFGRAAIDLTSRIAGLVDELGDVSTATGLSTDTVAGLKLAAESAGGTLAELSGGMQGFAKNLVMYEQGAGRAKKGLDALGFSSADATAMLADADGTVAEVVKRLQSVEDPARRAGLATQIFGDSGTKLIDALGGDELAVFVEQARAFGIDAGPAAAQAANDWQRAMAELSLVSAAAAQEVAAAWSGSGGPAESIRLVNAAVIFAGKAVAGVIDQVVTKANDAATVLQGLATGDLASVRRVLEEIASGQRDTLVDAWQSATDAAADYLDTARRAAQVAPGATAGGSAVAGGDGGAASSRAAAAAAREHAAAERERGQVLTELAEIQRRVSDDMLTQSELVIATRDRELDRLSALAEQYPADLEVLSETEAARVAILTEAEIEIAAIRDELAERRIEQAARVAAEEQAQIQAVKNATLAATSDLTGQLSALTTAAYDAEVKAGGDAAMMLWRLQKTAAAADIAANIAEGIAVAASLPPPADAIKAIAVGAAAALATAKLASAKPPAFDVGGLIDAQTPDQVTIRALPGEGVVSRAGMATLGADGLRELNRGSQGVGQQVVAVPVYQHWQRFARRAIDAPGPLRNALRKGRAVGALGY